MQYIVKLVVYSPDYDTCTEFHQYGLYANRKEALKARDFLINKLIFINQAYRNNLLYVLDPPKIGIDRRYDLYFKDVTYTFTILELD